jgi:hypothetical protein
VTAVRLFEVLGIVFVIQPGLSRPASLEVFSLKSRHPKTIQIGAHFVLIIRVKKL